MKKIAIITVLAFASIATLSACKENTDSAPAEGTSSATRESDLKAAYTTDDETLWIQYYDCVCEAADVMDAATETNISEQIAKLGQVVDKMKGIRAEFDKLGGALCPGSEEAVKQCSEARSRARARYNEAATSISQRELGHSRGRLQDAAAKVAEIFALPFEK